jgi:hypothetical protein
VEGSGFIGERGAARAEPSFEPPLDPGAGGPSVHGLSLVARIMRGRELAAEAAGIPPLDSDQVIDLQRTAGNSLTTHALSRWTDVLEAALAGEEAAALAAFRTVEDALAHPSAALLDRLLPARVADPVAHAAIAAALDARTRTVWVRVSCTAGPPAEIAVAVSGPAGARTEAQIELAPGGTIELALGFADAFGPAAALTQASALEVAVGGEPPTQLPIPFAAPRALQAGATRLVAFAELS